jgi:hypothetical protein
MSNFLKNRFAAVFLFLKRSFFFLILSDYCKDFNREKIISDLKKELAKSDKDIEDLIIEKIFFLSRTVETLIEIIEDELAYSYETRLIIAKKVMLCLSKDCPRQYIHLNVTHKMNPYRFMNYFRMIRKLQDNHGDIEFQAKQVLDRVEFDNLVKQIIVTGTLTADERMSLTQDVLSRL